MFPTKIKELILTIFSLVKDMSISQMTSSAAQQLHFLPVVSVAHGLSEGIVCVDDALLSEWGLSLAVDSSSIARKFLPGGHSITVLAVLDVSDNQK